MLNGIVFRGDWQMGFSLDDGELAGQDLITMRIHGVTAEWVRGVRPPTHSSPSAPTWLDEGLAALYEETAGETPLDNYRYFYVDAAIERGVLPSVGALLDATPDRFPAEYGRLVDAMARYLALYLFDAPMADPTPWRGSFVT